MQYCRYVHNLKILMAHAHQACHLSPSNAGWPKRNGKKYNIEIVEHTLFLVIPRIKYIGHVA